MLADPDDSEYRALAQRLSEYLAEAVHEKREARERARDEANDRGSPWTRFWKWLGKHATGVSAALAVVSLLAGAVWTLKQYFDQEKLRVERRREEAEIERQKAIGAFAGDLSDKAKRSGAAYAIAVLAGRDALPLLNQHFIASTRSPDDASFRSALAQAFIAIGPASLPELLRLNRLAARDGWTARNPVIAGTQPVITHFVESRDPFMAETAAPLAGVVIAGADFRYRNLDGANFREARLVDLDMCSVSLRSANLTAAVFAGHVQLGSGNLEGALLNRADLGNGSTSLSGALLARVQARKAKLGRVNLNGAVLRNADVMWSDLREASLDVADLSDADLSGSDLSSARLYKAKLMNARLTKARLVGADLERADLSGADLAGAVLAGAYDVPFTLGNAQAWARTGAHVLNANVSEAKNLDEATRDYLCRYGALNVPGGCGTVVTLPVPSTEGRRSGGSSSCWRRSRRRRRRFQV